jgi:hypothetical protein
LSGGCADALQCRLFPSFPLSGINGNDYSDDRESKIDRLEAMTAFVAVVEAGGLSAAARELGMPLTTVTLDCRSYSLLRSPMRCARVARRCVSV